MNLLLRFLTLSIFISASQLFAASAFEGKVTLSMMADKGKPMDMNYSIKGDKLRIDMAVEKGQAVSSIMNVSKMEMLILMPEQKMYMVMPIKKPVDVAIEKQNGADLEVTRTGKTETILGYKAEQIIVKDKKQVTELWVTEALGAFAGMNAGSSPFGGKSTAGAKWEEVLKGKSAFPLRVITRDLKEKQTFKMEATKITPTSLPDSLFNPPADYEKFQMPDMGGLNPFKR